MKVSPLLFNGRLPICKFPFQLEVHVCSRSLSHSLSLLLSALYACYSHVFNTFLAFILYGIDCSILHVHI